VAFTPRHGGENELDPQIVLFHEYAHHFLLAQSAVAYPAWLSEGYAEFVSTARFPKEGVMIGAPAQHRAWGLLDADKLPIQTLLAPGARLTSLQWDQIYGRGWLLTHYLFFGGKRPGQIGKYLAALNSGTPPLDAATQAFGDLKQLDRDLDAYLMASRMTVRTIGHARLPTITVDVRPLTPGERALITMRMTSTRGVDAKTAAPLHARATRAAAPFPNDPVAQGWLAEIAFDAGKEDEAEAAADRALAADPRSVQALLYKSMVRLRRAAAAKAPADDKAWKEARFWIVKANRINADAAAPLLLFYDSFAMAGAQPSKSAVLGLYRAQELAPQDEELRFRAARQFLTDGLIADAKRALRPLAFSPHASADNAAAKLLAMVEKGSTGPAAIAALDAEAKAAADKAAVRIAKE
jgi:tetratricopeptide (TPR) repeat protein